jgi:glucan biosynthesis protein C
VIGACGIERGLFASDGPLVRRWPQWLVAAVVLFFAWGGLTALATPNPWGDISAAPFGLRLAAGLSYASACFSSCFFVLAAAVRFGGLRSHLLGSLSSKAFGMYLVHYLFVVWLQFALLGVAFSGFLKAVIVFSGTLALSWSTTAALRRIPIVAYIIGATLRTPAGAR